MDLSISRDRDSSSQKVLGDQDFQRLRNWRRRECDDDDGGGAGGGGEMREEEEEEEGMKRERMTRKGTSVKEKTICSVH